MHPLLIWLDLKGCVCFGIGRRVALQRGGIRPPGRAAHPAGLLEVAPPGVDMDTSRCLCRDPHNHMLRGIIVSLILYYMNSFIHSCILYPLSVISTAVYAYSSKEPKNALDMHKTQGVSVYELLWIHTFNEMTACLLPTGMRVTTLKNITESCIFPLTGLFFYQLVMLMPETNSKM